MAAVNFHFPSSAGNYKTPVGNVYFLIWYDDTTGSDTDVNLDALKIGKLKYKIDVDISKQKQRFSSIAISFENKNNFFETSGILNSAKKNAIFMEMHIDGSVFFNGVLDWNQTKKTKWVPSGGNLRYNEITLVFKDRVADLNNYDLNDVGYAPANTVEDLLSKLAVKAGLNLNIVGNYKITETNGRIYAVKNEAGVSAQFKISGLSGTANALQTLKDLMFALGGFFVNQSGNLNIIFRDSIPTQSIDIADVIDINKVENYNNIQYIKVSALKDWNSVYPGVPAKTYSKSFGTKDNVNSKRNLELDLSALASGITVPKPATGNTGYPDPPDLPDSATNTTIDYASGNFYASSTYAEQGMVVGLNYDSVVLDFDTFSIIEEVPSLDSLVFVDNGPVNVAKEFQVFRNKAGAVDPCKVKGIVEKTAGIYNNALINKDDATVSLTGLRGFTNSLVILSDTFYPRSVEYDMEKNKTIFTCVY